MTRFHVVERSTGNHFWFDVRWGVPGNTAPGYIYAVPEGEEKRRSKRFMDMTDNRVPLDPDDCDITPWPEVDRDKIEREHSELRNAVDPAIKYLNDSFHPHATIIVTPTGAEVVEGCLSTGQVLDYI